MANLGQTFDANTVEPNAPIELLPPGNYDAQIVQSEMRVTKDGNGQYLWIELDIVSGQFTGRKLWDRLNLVNANEQASQIAQRTLSAICHATGTITVSDSEQLHLKPMSVTVKVRPAGPDRQGIQREASNEVKGYSKAGGTPVRSAPARVAAAPQPAAKPASRAPWAKAS